MLWLFFPWNILNFYLFIDYTCIIPPFLHNRFMHTNNIFELFKKILNCMPFRNWTADSLPLSSYVLNWLHIRQQDDCTLESISFCTNWKLLPTEIHSKLSRGKWSKVIRATSDIKQYHIHLWLYAVIPPLGRRKKNHRYSDMTEEYQFSLTCGMWTKLVDCSFLPEEKKQSCVMSLFITKLLFPASLKKRKKNKNKSLT